MESPIVDVLVPTSGSALSLGATLASLAGQRYPAFRVLALPPADAPDAGGDGAHIAALRALLEARGHALRLEAPGDAVRPAARRQRLLDQADAPYVIVVEDGVFLEPDLVGRLVAAIRSARCGFIGAAVVDLRFRGERRPDDERIEFWDGPVRPEEVAVGSRGWDRRRIHRGAVLELLRERLPRTRDRLYHVADVQGCVLYDATKLRAVGGFVERLSTPPPGSQPISGESAAQLRLLARNGGAGLFPSGAYRLAPAAGRVPPASVAAPARASAGRSADPEPERAAADRRRQRPAARPPVSLPARAGSRRRARPRRPGIRRVIR